MKILHCCLSCFFLDNYNYQENALPQINKMDGHKVKIIASTEVFIDNKTLGYKQWGSYQTEDGISITRVPYKKVISKKISSKIRAYKGVYTLINEFKPDVILFHGCCAYELLTIKKYVKNNPNVKFYVDSHEDFNNSAQNFVSKEILHRLFYKPILNNVLPYVEKILSISYETSDFLKDFYKVPMDKIEFYPLGGVLFNDEEYSKKRNKIRRLHGLNESDTLMVHSGKMNKEKKTIELLKAFTNTKYNGVRLFIIGGLSEDIEQEVYDLIENDKRITFLGWKISNILLEYLCASDIYLQPGTQSATMQNSMCCRNAVMLYPYKSHHPYMKENGFFVETQEEMERVFSEICKNTHTLKKMGENSYKIAKELLDYKMLAARLYR